VVYEGFKSLIPKMKVSNSNELKNYIF
jgi:hypothetical protein